MSLVLKFFFELSLKTKIYVYIYKLWKYVFGDSLPSDSFDGRFLEQSLFTMYDYLLYENYERMVYITVLPEIHHKHTHNSDRELHINHSLFCKSCVHKQYCWH